MKLLEIADSLLANLYRFPGDPLVSYYVGTFLLAMLTVIVGEFTISLVYRFNRSHYERIQKRISDLNELSQKALEAGDEKSYKACNKEAGEAFGRSFFNKFGIKIIAEFNSFSYRSDSMFEFKFR